MTHHDPEHTSKAKAWWVKNRAAYMQWRPTIVVFLFVVLAFFTLAYRQEHADGRITKVIAHDRAQQVAQCEVNNENTERLNTVLDTIITRIQESNIPAKEKREAVRLYSSAKGTKRDCTPLTSPPPDEGP